MCYIPWYAQFFPYKRARGKINSLFALLLSPLLESMNSPISVVGVAPVLLNSDASTHFQLNFFSSFTASLVLYIYLYEKQEKVKQHVCFFSGQLFSNQQQKQNNINAVCTGLCVHYQYSSKVPPRAMQL